MADIELDKVKRLTAYLDWALAEIQREIGSKLAGTRAGELLDNAEATAHELLTVLDVSPRALGTDQPTGESSTRH
jgi:hypothetical protein